MSCDPRELPALLAAQRDYFAKGETRALKGRLQRLSALAEEIERESDAILAALAADLGKPPLEAWLAEVYFTLSELKLFIRNLPRWSRPVRTRNPFYFLPARSEIRREPFGCALVAGPWNYPFQLALGPLLAAVAAGNCVILKPSELAPATSRLLADLLDRVFPREHVAVVEGGPDLGAALLDLPFDYFFFTGGEAVGRLFAAAAARHLAPVTLELGGKCPCLLDGDLDDKLDHAVERIVSTKFFNAGQTCVAPDFVLLPESLHDEFLTKARAAIESQFGSGSSEDLARIVNDRHYQRLLDLLPADALCIGTDDRPNRYLAPRLLPRATWDSPCMREEIFGPLLPMLTYSDIDEALQHLAKLPSPLVLYAFSRRPEFLEQAAAALRSGAVCFNDLMKTAAHPHLPLGGVGSSGMGRYHGRAGFETFTYARPVMRRWLLKDPFLITPPYRNRLEKLRRFLRP